MKIHIVGLVLIMLVGMVSAAPPEPGFLSRLNSLLGNSDDVTGTIISVLTGAGGIVAILVLQTAGIDIIGITIQAFLIFFDNLFLLARWALASESNLISMVILFITFWFILLFVI